MTHEINADSIRPVVPSTPPTIFFTTQELIDGIGRELVRRSREYPLLIMVGKLTQEQADREYRLMCEVRAFLVDNPVRERERLQRGEEAMRARALRLEAETAFPGDDDCIARKVAQDTGLTYIPPPEEKGL